MPTSAKPQRLRDPLHNLIEFGSHQFEHVLWQVIQTRPFQRLRRIRQLGFSEFVYDGATHTRFAHSVGVFHTARQLMRVIRHHVADKDWQEHQAQVALAAALVHDLGHGMFSHAFEHVGKELDLKMAKHELVSDALIRSGEVSEAFRPLGSGFAADVADVIKLGRPGNLYDAVVSSQFDADRLDYMQRDRFMTGVQNSGIDFTWLISNLEVGTIKSGVDEKALGEIQTFVLGPKAIYAAETYVLALFQLYPTVYFHKTTRGAEKLFSALMLQLVALVRDGQEAKTALPANHPIIEFTRAPESLDKALRLDDSVFWGALPMLSEAQDPLLKEFSRRIWHRQLPKCIDIRQRLLEKIAPKRPSTADDRDALKKRLDRHVASIGDRLTDWSKKSSTDVPRVLLDRDSRPPYRRFQESKGPLNQIHIRVGQSIADVADVADVSPIVGAIDTFELFRAYVSETDKDAKTEVEKAIADEIGRK